MTNIDPSGTRAAPAIPPTILFVEDDDMVRQITEETLRAVGYRVVSVQDGIEALEALRQMQPDLILSDVRMPRCDGFELLRRLRCDPLQDRTPFIIMSAKAETSDQRMGMSLGADDYVTKPFKPGDLLKTIEMRLQRAAAINDILQQQQRFLMRVLPHELRTPLTGIIGYAELLTVIGESGETLKPEELVDYGYNIGKSGARLLRVAEDFSLWSWLEAEVDVARKGRASPMKAQVLDGAALRRWCHAVAESYGRSGDCAIEVETVHVMAPGDGLDRVVTHLVENACKFSLPGTRVSVAVRTRNSLCEIVVTDSGRGMSEEEIARVGVMRQFGRERFEQQGMGMGLVLVQTFARLGGGDFTMERNATEGGITVRLRLPVLAEPGTDLDEAGGGDT